MNKTKLNQADVENTITIGAWATSTSASTSASTKTIIPLTPKNSILEQCIKEWEALGYEWEKRENIILIFNRKIDKMISIHTIGRGYSCSDSDGVDLWITFQEHLLLTKTLKWLGWFDV